MEPVEFPESTSVLKGWESRWEGDPPVSDLHVFKDGTQIISKWRLSWRERLKLLFHGHVWVFVMAPVTAPPVAVSVHYPFVKAEK